MQRKKSSKKIKRDNDRAARFQERKKKEKEAASAPESADKSEAIVTSSPGAESAMTISGLEFSFSSPVPENLRHDSSQGTSMILSDKKEQKKQDDVSNLEFQGEEEEMEESDDNIADPLSSISEYRVPQGNFIKSYAAAATRSKDAARNLTPPPAPLATPAPTSIHPHTYSPPAPLTSPLAQGGSTITIGQIPGINPETQQHLQWIKQQIHLTEQITGSTTVKSWY
mgnify:CR=1 FL=1